MCLKMNVEVDVRAVLRDPPLDHIWVFKQCDLQITTFYFTASMILYIYTGDH